ncbi:alpha/beta hydrolase [Crossiella sp. NPDC003009]
MWLHLVDACAHWPEPAERYTGPFHRRTAPILLTNNRIDPTTPLDGARRAERLLGNARLVIADGAGHIPHSAALIGAIEDYLRTVRLPQPGTSYPVDRLPFS